MDARVPPLHAVHDDRGARFTEFGGWEMPVEFDSIREEHAAVRESAGIFDVSHMGEILVSGPDAVALSRRLVTNDVVDTDPGAARYAAVTNDDGVMLDDTVLYRLPENDDADVLFVPNAGHDEEMEQRWKRHRDEWDMDATVENVTEERAMFAVQGPDAEDLVAEAADERVADLSPFTARYAPVAGERCWVARTGYTGEDGFELILPADAAETVWEAIDCQPCGLGARDTLRMEAGLLLSGQDFDPDDEPRTPYEAGIGFTVKLDAEFVGRDALERQKEEGVDERFVGLTLIDRGVPRHGYPITDGDGREVGVVTSGTMSPTLEEPIGLGYVDTDYADDGAKVRVEVRGESKKAKIQSLPFVDNR